MGRTVVEVATHIFLSLQTAVDLSPLSAAQLPGPLQGPPLQTPDNEVLMQPGSPTPHVWPMAVLPEGCSHHTAPELCADDHPRWLYDESFACVDANNLCGIEVDDDFDIRDLQDKNVILMLSEDKLKLSELKANSCLTLRTLKRDIHYPCK